ncbi:SDR family NAD(P)-dependent oxidoreductase [Mesorhizobium sp. KR9-304]|uniref:SDR family NAD(P)-dependent oxidoreductase n=1 Tax=Mesorhizobium sp. KR9-304 TaxID=3156614 RepID=UPI0032B4028C
MKSQATILDEMFSLKGKVALVTGAAGGVGQTFATGLARAGATMALCDIQHDALNPVIATIENSGGSAEGFFVDLASQASILSLRDQLASSFGRVDILVTAPPSTSASRSSTSMKAPTSASWPSICAVSINCRRPSSR